MHGRAQNTKKLESYRVRICCVMYLTHLTFTLICEQRLRLFRCGANTHTHSRPIVHRTDVATVERLFSFHFFCKCLPSKRAVRHQMSRSPISESGVFDFVVDFFVHCIRSSAAQHRFDAMGNVFGFFVSYFVPCVCVRSTSRRAMQSNHKKISSNSPVSVSLHCKRLHYYYYYCAHSS